MATEHKQKASTTAILVAAIRASHLIWNQPAIFSDTYALQMVTPFWRQVAKNRVLNWLIKDALLGVLKPIHTEAILRVRFTEDRLREAVSGGVGQYVILGAGLDTFSLRQGDLAGRLRIFEVDQPASQGMKRERVTAVNGSVPDNLTFVPVDFETDHLDEALRRSGFDADTPAFFSWLGTTYYLTGESDQRYARPHLLACRPRQPHRLRLQVPARDGAAGRDRVHREAGEVRGAPRGADDLDVHPRRHESRTGAGRLRGGRQRVACRGDRALSAGAHRHARAGPQLRVRAVRKEAREAREEVVTLVTAPT